MLIPSNVALVFVPTANLATLSLTMRLNGDNFGMQMVLDALHHSPQLICYQILQIMGKSLKQEMKESIRWTENFKSSDFKSGMQIIYAYTKHLIENDHKYFQKVSYNFAINLLKVLSGPKVMIEKRVFAKEALESLKRVEKDYSLDGSRIAEADYLALHSRHMKYYKKLLENSLEDSRRPSLGDPEKKLRKH